MNKFPKPLRDPWAWLYWGLFFAVVPLVALWMAYRAALQVNLPVPAHDLPPYHIISANDLTIASVSPHRVTEETIRNVQDLVGCYTLQALAAGEPFLRSQIVAVPDPALVTDTLAVAVSTDSANILGGALRPGDVVTLAAVPASDSVTPAILFDAVLVLDVRRTENGTIIVLAIPTTRWSEYLARTRNATLVLARRLQ